MESCTSSAAFHDPDPLASSSLVNAYWQHRRPPNGTWEEEPSAPETCRRSSFTVYKGARIEVPGLHDCTAACRARTEHRHHGQGPDTRLDRGSSDRNRTPAHASAMGPVSDNAGGPPSVGP